MTENYRPLDYIEPYLADFKQDVNLRARMKGELDKMLKLMVQWHLEESVRLYLKLKKNPSHSPLGNPSENRLEDE